MTNGEIFGSTEEEWRAEIGRRMAGIRIGAWWSCCGCADVAELIKDESDMDEARNWFQGQMDDPFSIAPAVWDTQPALDV